MKNSLKAPVVIFSFIAIVFVAVKCSDAPKEKTEGKEKREAFAVAAVNPFKNHRDSVPSSSQYSGPLFTLSHDYPDTVSTLVNPPWQQALNGKEIWAGNALNYVNALKQYVEPSITQFLFDRNNWNAASEGWYQEPWTGDIREAILGTYVGNGFGPGTFTSLPKKAMTTYVLTLYDKRAAYTLGKIWGKTGRQPNLQNNAAQFNEGSVIVKFAFTSVNYPDWDVMQNALTYPIYDTATAYTDPVYKIRNVSFFQFDIIVKDSKTAPKTGWVFSTLVYDKNASGKTAWDKMVPLGAQWGNDPGINSTKYPKAPLNENVINPQAPPYSTETLGWGGRMSGPNDGAVIPYAYDPVTKKTYNNLRASSCMSCHSPAQDKLASFLFPGPFPSSNSDTLSIFTPGGAEWFRWFADNNGNVPFDSGQTAVDFDMVTAYKSIPAWQNTQGDANVKTLEAVRRYRLKLNSKYNGR